MNIQLPDNQDSRFLHLWNMIVPALCDVPLAELEENRRIVENLEVILQEKDAWEFKAMPSFDAIVISTRAVEIVWSYCYAYYSLYLRLRGIDASGQYVDLKNDGENAMLSQVIDWATRNLIDDENIDFPDHFPAKSSEDLHLVDRTVERITMATLAFMLQHELAHIKLKSTDFSVVLEEEAECDQEAARVVLGREEDSLVNGWGVATGLILISSIGIKTGFFDGIEHPSSYDRLINVLCPLFGEEKDDLWGWVVAMQSLHMTNAKIPQPATLFDNFRLCALEYRNIFEAKHTTSAQQG